MGVWECESIYNTRYTIHGHRSSVSDCYLYIMETIICICGAGTMGRGIALAVASHGIQAILYDLNPGIISGAAKFIEKELDQGILKRRISADDKENILRRILFTTSISDCRAPIIIEAIIENTEKKASLFLELAEINKEDTIFASNTSSLSITGIAGKTAFRERVIGMHFFNPADRMKLVEIIRTKYNSEEIINRAAAFVNQLEKTPVICMDAPGFIVNHVARPFYLEALRLAGEEIADISTIDRIMESAGFKMGPFHLMDMIGNDINYTVSCSLYDSLGKPERLKPSALQESMVREGKFGRKTGSGYFQYAKSEKE
jgi:3-hydroxybutyryl-CoA dehydrogenase